MEDFWKAALKVGGPVAIVVFLFGIFLTTYSNTNN